MSALPADLSLRPRSGSATRSQTPRPQLRRVPRPEQRLGGLGFVLLLTAILAVGMFGLVMLNTQIQDQSFDLSKLRTDAARLTEKEAALQSQLNTLTSAKDLADRASALGMVPAVHPGIMTLADGRVTGEPKPVGDYDLTNIRTPAQIEAAAKAKAAEEARKAAEAEAAKKAAEEAAAKKAAEEAAAKKAAEDAAKAKATQPPAPPAAPTPKPTQTTGR